MPDKKTIVTCSKCNGLGKIECSERYDYHHKYDWVWDEPCEQCGGTGRMWEIVTTTYQKLTDEDLELTPKPKEAEE